MKPASLDRQFSAMDSLAWRVTYEWNCAKNRCLTMDQMQSAWRDRILQSADYQRLAGKRKEAIRFLWYHTRNRVLAENQIYGWWLSGRFYGSWCELPESIRYDDSALAKLPKGHFWLDGNRQTTTIRYYISSDSAGEDRSHFLAPSDPIHVCN
jgi:hypothetical protein